MDIRFGVIGSGSWATALTKILTDNRQPVGWYIRKEASIRHIQARHHNPHYLPSVYFDTNLLTLSDKPADIVDASDCLVMAVPSAYTAATLEGLDRKALRGKKILSAIKGILPEQNLLLNEYLAREFDFPLADYYTVMGPCHAEEVAAEKLSYLTFSGENETSTQQLASYFTTDYLNTIINQDVYGVQYAAILKNIYALGAGIAHGLEYGDNFLSVLIANCADEMAGFLRKVGIRNIAVGVHEGEDPVSHRRRANYAASVYLGDLLVTCYSLYSRNRTFGNMIGKGYSVKTAQLELNMVAEGYNASKCIYLINKDIKAEMPIAGMIYHILWENVKAGSGFKQIESYLV
ncbi:NAD(P)H-dependent glycerol-3-phosphate dehydrogenase [Puia dinghuensis]|uniref:Glycerol-3-phosphate dehydrogenase n=1 Tax=Puia dinghuensis TaxID=1792502 RepID=A0A8J2UEV3_9BACT|nr:NAD(P)H-dependent glycerol-3-phosphate dehydrogenase [Puia dinghuensis]GGB07881.1 glycerol-3-phosphate dehydrogenase [Puia dinghuensis]